MRPAGRHRTSSGRVAAAFEGGTRRRVVGWSERSIVGERREREPSTDSPGLWHHAVASAGQPLTDQAPRPDRKRVSRGTSSGRQARPPQSGSYRGRRARRAMIRWQVKQRRTFGRRAAIFCPRLCAQPYPRQWSPKPAAAASAYACSRVRTRICGKSRARTSGSPCCGNPRRLARRGSGPGAGPDDVSLPSTHGCLLAQPIVSNKFVAGQMGPAARRLSASVRKRAAIASQVAWVRAQARGNVGSRTPMGARGQTPAGRHR